MMRRCGDGSFLEPRSYMRKTTKGLFDNLKKIMQQLVFVTLAQIGKPPHANLFMPLSSTISSNLDYPNYMDIQ